MTDANEKQLKTGLPKHVRLKDFNKHIMVEYGINYTVNIGRMRV